MQTSRYTLIYQQNTIWYASRDERSFGGWDKYKKRAWLYSTKKDALIALRQTKKFWKSIKINKILVQRLRIEKERIVWAK